MNTLRKIFPALITIFFLVMISLLIRRVIVENNRNIEGNVDLSTIVKNWEDRNDYYLIYYNNYPSGLLNSAIKKSDYGYKILSKLYLKVPVSHFTFDITMDIAANLGGRFELRDFDFQGNFAETKISLEGVINKGNIRYVFTKNGEVKRDILQINNDISLVEVVRPFILKNLDLEKGKSYSLPVSNPFKEILDSSLGFNKSVIVMTILDEEIINFQEEKVRAKKVEFRTEGIVTYQWFDEKGNFLRGEMFSGLMLEAASKEYIKDKHNYFLTKIEAINDSH